MEKPAYWRMVQGRPAYMVARTPRMKGAMPGQAVGGLEALEIGGGVERLDGKAFGRGPGEAIEAPALELLLSQRGPLVLGLCPFAFTPGNIAIGWEYRRCEIAVKRFRGEDKSGLCDQGPGLADGRADPAAEGDGLGRIAAMGPPVLVAFGGSALIGHRYRATLLRI